MTDILRFSRMAKRADAIIIGAGVIGAAVAFELAKRGYKTLNIDKLPASGYGPTSNSCAIVRAHYSSREGVAMAYEGFFYWKDWENYLGTVDDAGTAKYMNCGTVLLKSATGHHERSSSTTATSAWNTRSGTTRRSSRRSPSTRPTRSGRRSAP